MKRDINYTVITEQSQIVTCTLQFHPQWLDKYIQGWLICILYLYSREIKISSALNKYSLNLLFVRSYLFLSRVSHVSQKNEFITIINDAHNRPIIVEKCIQKFPRSRDMKYLVTFLPNYFLKLLDRS